MESCLSFFIIVALGFMELCCHGKKMAELDITLFIYVHHGPFMDIIKSIN